MFDLTLNEFRDRWRNYILPRDLRDSSETIEVIYKLCRILDSVPYMGKETFNNLKKDLEKYE